MDLVLCSYFVYAEYIQPLVHGPAEDETEKILVSRLMKQGEDNVALKDLEKLFKQGRRIRFIQSPTQGEGTVSPHKVFRERPSSFRKGSEIKKALNKSPLSHVRERSSCRSHETRYLCEHVVIKNPGVASVAILAQAICGSRAYVYTHAWS